MSDDAAAAGTAPAFRVGQRVSFLSKPSGRTYEGTIQQYVPDHPKGNDYAVVPDHRGCNWTAWLTAEEMTPAQTPVTALAAAKWWAGHMRRVEMSPVDAQRFEDVLALALAREMAQGYDRVIVETKTDGHPCLLLALAAEEARVELAGLPAWAWTRITDTSVVARISGQSEETLTI